MAEESEIKRADIPNYDQLLESVRAHPEQVLDMLGITSMTMNALLSPESVCKQEMQVMILRAAAHILKDYILEFQRQARAFWKDGGFPVIWKEDGAPRVVTQEAAEDAADSAQFECEQGEQDRPVEFPPEEM